MKRVHFALPPIWATGVLFLSISVTPLPSIGQTIDPASATLVDLTYAFDGATVYWPTSPTGFRLDTLAWGRTEGGYFYSSASLSTPEHGGTHLDAPVHFGEGRQTTDRIPLDKLIAPGVLIDVTASAARNADYRLTPDDVLRFEQEHGKIQPGTIVLLRTGWGRRWPDRKAYLGDDTPGDASGLHFPSFGAEAARLLVKERRVAALGADVASIDYGASTDFLVHRIAAAADVPGLENLANLDELPESGFLVIALPMKIRGGTGGPLRAVALIP